MEVTKKEILVTIGSILAFAISSVIGFYYYIDTKYEKKKDNLNKVEKNFKDKEAELKSLSLKLNQREVDLKSLSLKLDQRKVKLSGKENICNNNYRFNILMDEYKKYSGVDYDSEYYACSEDEKTFDKLKCIEIKEKKQKSFSALSQICFYAKKNGTLDINFQSFLQSEKIRLNDTRDIICRGVAPINWKK